MKINFLMTKMTYSSTAFTYNNGETFIFIFQGKLIAKKEIHIFIKSKLNFHLPRNKLTSFN